MQLIKTFLTVVLCVMPSFVFAHGMIASSYPKNGAAISVPISHVEVNFSKPMKLIGLKMKDASGKPVAIDFKRSKTSGTHFTVPTPNLEKGSYKVAWKAMGSDGHLVKGAFGFTQQ